MQLTFCPTCMGFYNTHVCVFPSVSICSHVRPIGFLMQSSKFFYRSQCCFWILRLSMQFAFWLREDTDSEDATWCQWQVPVHRFFGLCHEDLQEWWAIQVLHWLPGVLCQDCAPCHGKRKCLVMLCWTVHVLCCLLPSLLTLVVYILIEWWCLCRWPGYSWIRSRSSRRRLAYNFTWPTYQNGVDRSILS